jgi:hypothetical protein
MATEGTKFQINYKLSDGTLINLYAATVAELESGLADIAMNAANIKATAVELGVGSAPAPTVASVAQAFNATPVSGDTPTCRHGAMNYREGTSARGPWKAHMCSAPKGAMDKCDPIFIR